MTSRTNYALQRSAEMLQRYDAGETAAALGAELGMSTGDALRTSQLARNAGKAKGPRGPRGPNMKNYPALTPERRSQLAAQELQRRFVEVKELVGSSE